MVTVHLKHTGTRAHPRPLSRLDVVLPAEPTVRQLLAYLLERGDVIGRKEEYAADTDTLFLILLNGRPLRELDGPDTVVKDQDTVAILLPVLGG